MVATNYGFRLARNYPIDGKSLRCSYDPEKGLKNLHLVTAWASEQRLVLGASQSRRPLQ